MSFFVYMHIYAIHPVIVIIVKKSNNNKSKVTKSILKLKERMKERRKNKCIHT